MLSNPYLLLPLAVICYAVGLMSYRLKLHPLARFPGPKLAALTSWYEFYQDVIRDGGGKYHWDILQMHEEYAPNEIHVNDPEYYEVLFAGGNEIRNKHAPFARMVGTSVGVFSTVDHHLHRRRKAALGHFFSKRAIHMKESILREKLKMLWNALETQSRLNELVDVHASFLSFATDIFCVNVLGRPLEQHFLSDLKHQFAWQKTMSSIEELTPLIKQLQFLVPIITGVPSWILRLFAPGMARVFAVREDMRAIARDEMELFRKIDSDEKATLQPKNVFQTILESNLPIGEKRLERLEHESFELLMASGQTLARNLTLAIFHLLANAEKLERLRGEVQRQMNISESIEMTLSEIESLPYLKAVIKEALRVSAIVFSRLPITAPASELEYGGYVIPAGTPVSMTPADILLNEQCFVDARSFKPERWLGEDGLEVPADKYFVPFSKGSRSCPGINMVYAEMSLVLAEMVVRYDMSLYDTIRERDVDHARDLFLGKPDKSSKGVRLMLQLRDAQRTRGQ